MVKTCFVRKALAAAAIVMILGAGTASAAPEYKWRFGQTSVRASQGKSYKLFCELIKKYSNGRIEVEFFPDNQLGTLNEIFHAVQDGEIEMCGFAPYVNLVPGGMFNWMPWTVESWEECKMAFSRPDGCLYVPLEEAMKEVGVHILFTVSQGSYGIGNSVRPIKTPADFKNLKMRVSSSLGCVRGLQNMAEGTGMTVETVPWGDLYNALAKGVVDGCWDMWPSLVEERHCEVMKYYTSLDWMWDANQVVINAELWAKLPDDLKAAIRKAADEAEADQYAIQIAEEDNFKEFLKKQPNFEIYYPTEAERAEFRNRARNLDNWNDLCKPWLDKHFPGQDMTVKILDQLRINREKVLADKAAAAK
ncbi:TRAP transporter substrate-binding protein [Pyramidobacter sp.]|uniref:TRAP transporter substrate-binding protein n=1 Tax=Pyramidobacter sp. TaxID=1943581 RepID=UPI0025FDE396|nr:TRAP transporter substrate-binding protein [Pyramidobacter sp.]MCI7403982.1 TRAP transporter substrate-binding protein [Pyramidobacter sp.]MDY3212312.1 TRAP transporter substrate-binding protein [Pyramidobacter sp.]